MMIGRAGMSVAAAIVALGAGGALANTPGAAATVRMHALSAQLCPTAYALAEDYYHGPGSQFAGLKGLWADRHGGDRGEPSLPFGGSALPDDAVQAGSWVGTMLDLTNSINRFWVMTVGAEEGRVRAPTDAELASGARAIEVSVELAECLVPSDAQVGALPSALRSFVDEAHFLADCYQIYSQGRQLVEAHAASATREDLAVRVAALFEATRNTCEAES